MWKNPLIKIALSLLASVVATVRKKYPPLGGYLSTLLNPLRKGIEILIDKNPNDKEQYEQLFLEERAAFTDNSGLLLATQLQKWIKDKFVSQVVISSIIEFLESDGTPITEEMKKMFPSLPYGVTGFGGSFKAGNAVNNQQEIPFPVVKSRRGRKKKVVTDSDSEL